jgi:putative PIN family toxin of toxin-antitoxin system
MRTPGPVGPAAPRIVLDTNVCLDLLLFEDPRVNLLAEALRSGNVVAVVDEDCRAEWLRVLGYPALRLQDPRRSALIDAFDALMQPVSTDANRRDGKPPPRCVDPDDQKFLRLAHATGARWLLSRDQHLLVLAARCRRDGLFEILTPQDWAARFADAASA